MTTNNNDEVIIKFSDSESKKLYVKLHINYITSLAKKLNKSTSYEGAVTEHLRMSGVYWSLTALSLLMYSDSTESTENDELKNFIKMDKLMNITGKFHNEPEHKDSTICIIDWLFQCYDESSGGFGGNFGHDGHILYTLSALQILALIPSSSSPENGDKYVNCGLNDPRLNKEKIIQFVLSVYNKNNGSFAGDCWGEVDTRFTYCSLYILSLLDVLDVLQEEQKINLDLIANYVMQCCNTYDGGFGCVPGAESHAGQIFTCIGALSIAQRLHLLFDNNGDKINNNNNNNTYNLLSWWLSERQCDSGGLNGRPEKQADVCYSWWILSALSIMGRINYISGDKLGKFILNCQDDDDGGIADRPDDMVDVFHTFFGIAGLSLLGYLHNFEDNLKFPKIDPIYVIPTSVCNRLQLNGQIIKDSNISTSTSNNADDNVDDDRLRQYNVMNV